MLGGGIPTSEYDLGDFAIGLALVVFLIRWVVIYEGWFFGMPTEIVPFRWEPLVSMLLMFAMGLLLIELNPSIDHERRYSLEHPVKAFGLGVVFLLLMAVMIRYFAAGLGLVVGSLDSAVAATGSAVLATITTIGVVITLAVISAIALYFVVGVIISAMFGYLAFGWLVVGDYGHGPVIVFASLLAGAVVFLPVLTLVWEGLIVALGLGGILLPSVEARLESWRTVAPE